MSSHVKAFNYFGGVPKRIILDNLKAGVIKPDLYDPQFNRAYREMAEHYDTFLDPARVRSPKDKGKVERDVQTAREKFKELTALYPTITPAELNQRTQEWLRNDYGMTKHGTTHQMPYKVFSEGSLRDKRKNGRSSSNLLVISSNRRFGKKLRFILTATSR